jgi:hypothetical protein
MNKPIVASTPAGSFLGLNGHHRFLEAVAALAWAAMVETLNLKGAYQKLHSIDCVLLVATQP